MARISILGTGAMGSRMAITLLKAGHQVRLWNRNREKTLPLAAAGASVADSPRAAVVDADIAISMVRDDRASRQVWLHPDTGAIAGLPADSIAIESATVTLEWAREFHEACARRGIACLDAPVAGSRPQAEAAQLIYLVGGERETVTRAEPILRTMGAAVHHVGPAGAGAAAKLMVNALFGVQVAAMGEIIGLIRCCGLDTAKVIEVISATPVCSPAAKLAASAMLARNFAPMFPIELAAKDFGYAVEAAAATHAPTPIVRAVEQVFAQALRQGYGNDNITGLVQLYNPSISANQHHSKQQ